MVQNTIREPTTMSENSIVSLNSKATIRTSKQFQRESNEDIKNPNFFLFIMNAKKKTPLLDTENWQNLYGY